MRWSKRQLALQSTELSGISFSSGKFDKFLVMLLGKKPKKELSIIFCDWCFFCVDLSSFIYCKLSFLLQLLHLFWGYEQIPLCQLLS